MSRRRSEYAAFDPEAIDALRPVIRGHRHAIVAGHYLASQAGFAILEAGGNAIDAGVAAGIALGVVHSDLVNVGGVAPIILYSAKTGQVETISGLGTWPAAMTPDLFQREHDGHIPVGLLRTVAPAAPDAWITALERHGTMTFGEVAEASIRLARDGFVMYPLMASIIAKKVENYARWPSNAAIYLPGGRPPAVGDVFVQADLGRSLQYMADEERAAGGDRAAGLSAARAAFYRGDIAAAIVQYHRENGGLLTADDLASFRVAVEPPERVTIEGIDVYACGPWCQGPALLQALRLLDTKALAAHGHNSPDALHMMVEALKLAFADRERWIGDPRFVDVPTAALLSDDYIASRRSSHPARRGLAGDAAGGRPHGRPCAGRRFAGCRGGGAGRGRARHLLRLRHRQRGQRLLGDAERYLLRHAGDPRHRALRLLARRAILGRPAHASSVAPGKRPRLTPNPALAIKDGAFVIPFGTPGGDVQIQAMLQTFVNIVTYGMNPQAAVEAPRFATMSFPNSFEPHEYHPNKLMLEARIPEAAGEALAAWGHGVDWWPEWAWPAGAMCVLVQDIARGTISGRRGPAAARLRARVVAGGSDKGAAS